MGKGLSYQQKQILKILSDKKAHRIAEFKKFYENSNIYPALNTMIYKELVKQIEKKYYITEKGEEILFFSKMGFI